jgi:hypothetical protein
VCGDFRIGCHHGKIESTGGRVAHLLPESIRFEASGILSVASSFRPLATELRHVVQRITGRSI